MASKLDVSFKNEEINAKFNFRVAGIITKKDKVLIQKSANDNYYALVGGRVNFLESTEDAIIREIKEEIGIDVNKDKLLLVDIVENFFEYNNTKFHELLFIYKIDVSDYIKDYDNIKTIDKDTSTNIWFTKDEVSKLDLRPVIAKELLDAISLKHEIQKD